MTTQTTTFNWGKFLKVLIAVLTAIGSLGLAGTV